jgi:protein involved in polysaccharide export with SLBB domain
MRPCGSSGRIGWGVLLAGVLLSGCSVSPGNSLILFPEGHPLIDSAKDMRAAAPEALPIPKELHKHVLPPYTVEPGDVLLVQPADLDSPIRLPGDQPVLTDGTINLGRYGQLVVAGKAVEQIEVEIRAVIQNYLAAQPRPPGGAPAPGQAGGEARLPLPSEVGPIVVRVITRVSKVYYVLGEVNAPGAFTLSGRETVLDGILAAGGINDRGSRRNVILARPTAPDSCRVVLPICYYEIVQLGDTSTNYQLAPGDRIYVPTRTLWEQLFHPKTECPPCGRAQVPCTAVQGAGCGAGGEGLSRLFGTVPHFTGAEPAAPGPAAAPEGPAVQSPTRALAPEAPLQQTSYRTTRRLGAPTLWDRVTAFFDF